MQALKGMKDDTLYKNLLPRTLSFAEVLHSEAVETAYTITDTNIDYFYMLRYELHSCFNKNLYQNEKKNDLFLLGKRPLTKVNGQSVKDVMKKVN